MKNLSKVGLLLLMLLLVAGAFILPKFVQRAEPPTPKEDLAAALAAVEIPEEATAADETFDAGLRETPEYEEFFQFLDESDFESARNALLTLSETADEETIEILTNEMEKSVNALAPVETPEPPIIALIESPTEAAAEAVKTPESVSAPASDAIAPPSYDPGETVRIMTLIQKSEFAEVEKRIDAITGTAPAETIQLLNGSLASAQKNQQALEASRLELQKTKEEVSTLKKEGVAQIKESVAELKEATLSANLAVKEVNALKDQLIASGSSSTGTAPLEQPAPVAKKAQAPPEIPPTKGITFGLNSTRLSDSSKKTLSDAAGKLKAEPRLTLQLRGYADPSGSSEYNAILAKARSEAAKDYLIEKEIAASRVDVTSFGDTRSEDSPAKPEELRRVDLVYRTE
ncbi:MAG: OmpA family protein [Verrucomicrobiales bacterium]|nr:OmpA family protein [Verrucomicrobiales bacterium]